MDTYQELDKHDISLNEEKIENLRKGSNASKSNKNIRKGLKKPKSLKELDSTDKVLTKKSTKNLDRVKAKKSQENESKAGAVIL